MKSLNHKGFTLIELLVVISIIGLLSSVVMASLSTARSKAKDSKRIQDIKQLQLALELYANDNNGSYPGIGAHYNSISSCVFGAFPDWVTVFDNNFKTKYMSQIPVEPVANQCYHYLAFAKPVSVGSNNGTGYSCRKLDGTYIHPDGTVDSDPNLTSTRYSYLITFQAESVQNFPELDTDGSTAGVNSIPRRYCIFGPAM